MKPKMGNDTTEFTFIKPIEAPVFTPTEDEFRDPLAYLNKIRPHAEKAGICKIKPPSDWHPPFAVDVDNFKFTPRIQRLNELEAKTRIKLNFLDRIAKFWELQGTSLKIPLIDKKPLDLYNLYQLVKNEGGKEKINNDKKWNSIASRIGYDKSRNLGSTLRAHYEKFLFPFDVFENAKEKLTQESTSPKGSPMKMPPKKIPPMKVNNNTGRMGGKIKTPVLVDDRPLTASSPNELKRLAFYGAGPKMAGFNSKSSQNIQLRMNQLEHVDVLDENVNVRLTTGPHQDPMSKYMCHICGRGDSEGYMLLCDGCDDSYHTFCLEPKLTEVPKGEWRCPKCVADEVSKPSEAFGFEQAAQEYTLHQFGEMADAFKSEYFNMPVHVVPLDSVEREFWRIVSAIDEDVTVEYGADLHSMDHGSGFPTANCTSQLTDNEMKYINSGWNLNNLPVLAGSVLGHINTDISGMMVPWMYVGMCFATFCWHNEDHWSYSINYLHWGEPKTWYGVPGNRADDFEDAMKKAAPELFHSQPDLLHQLVTIMNPNILMGAGVPVYRMDQKAGEFIVTFPRAYHAGFNQGYNFAEAVNFAPADWLSMGRACVEHYSLLHRYCVFSHDELVCKMSTQADDLDLMIAIATYKDLMKMYEAEKEYRRVVLAWGVTQCERVAFELVPDDAKLCEYCKTTCFLSAITCQCSKEQLVCLKHFDKLCDCSAHLHTLKYRYTLDEIPVMMTTVKERSDEYEAWAKSLRDILYPSGEKTEFYDLCELLAVAGKKKYPVTSIHEVGMKIKKRADNWTELARRMTNTSVRTRNRNTEGLKLQLPVEDLELFLAELTTIPVKLREANSIRLLVEKVKIFKERAQALLHAENPKVDDLKCCIDMGQEVDVSLPEMPHLKNVLERSKFIEYVENSSLMNKNDDGGTGCWTVEFLDKLIEMGEKLIPTSKVASILEMLRRSRKIFDEWEERSQKLLTSRSKVSREILKKYQDESKSLPLYIPSVALVKDIIKKTNDWVTKSKAFRGKKDNLYLDELEAFIKKGEQLPVTLSSISTLKAQITVAKVFLTSMAKLFLKSRSIIDLIEAVVPRTAINCVAQRGVIKRFDVDKILSKEKFAEICRISLNDLESSAKLLESLIKKEKEELEQITHVRKVNLAKRVSGNEEERYCVCHSKWETGLMIQCHLCYEHFHATCIPIRRNMVPTSGNISSLAMSVYQILARNVRFFCPGCCRTKRPNLLTLLDSLRDLQPQIVWIPEGEGLEYLSGRATRWLDKARAFLHRKEIDHAITLTQPFGVLRLKDLPKQYDRYKRTGAVDYVAVWRTGSRATITTDTVDMKKVISGTIGLDLWQKELRNFVGKPSLDPRNCTFDPNRRAKAPVGPTSSESENRIHRPDRQNLCYPSNDFSPNMVEAARVLCLLSAQAGRGEIRTPAMALLGSPKHNQDTTAGSSDQKAGTCRQQPMSECAAIADHGYFALQKTPPPSPEPKKGHRSSLLLNRNCYDEDILVGPKINLPKELLVEMDYLLMEGDLLELTIPESDILYRLREFTKPPERVLDVTIIHDCMEAEIAFKNCVVNNEDADQLDDLSASPITGLDNKGRLRHPSKTESGTLTETESRKRKTGGSMGSKRQTKRKKKDEKDKDAVCAAKKCIKPTGKIDWVQCEYGCDLWFHYVCVGLRQADVDKMVRYCCTACENRKTKVEDLQECDENEKPQNSLYRNKSSGKLKFDEDNIAEVEVKTEPPEEIAKEVNVTDTKTKSELLPVAGEIDHSLESETIDTKIMGVGAILK